MYYCKTVGLGGDMSDGCSKTFVIHRVAVRKCMSFKGSIVDNYN
ncbi:hypothetical protein PC121_g18452 [Phytophthora cactorum]|nr:hypothetical protein PC120_g19966 [Phytophthora cactorum]KAG3050316.1 hypothetical protein PC121_g18452 [Phytophthora cactorum]